MPKSAIDQSELFISCHCRIVAVDFRIFRRILDLEFKNIWTISSKEIHEIFTKGVGSNQPIGCNYSSPPHFLADLFGLALKIGTHDRKRAQMNNDSSIMTHNWTSSDTWVAQGQLNVLRNDIIVNLGLSWVKTRSLRLIFSYFWFH